MTEQSRPAPAAIDPQTRVWAAGWNDFGYSPDPDNVAIFARQEWARDYVADAIDRLADFLADVESDSATVDYPTAEAFDNDTDRLSFGAAADAENIKGNADGDYSGEFSIYVEDGRPLPTVYWVQQTTLADAFGDDTDSDEYRAVTEDLPPARMTEAQDNALRALCERYGVTYRPDDYWPTFDLPAGYVAGWVGGNDGPRSLYMGCAPDGSISS